mgnify:CR=1 FL=1
MKHLIVGIFTVFIFILMGYTYKTGGAHHGGEAGKIVEDLKTFEQKKNSFAKEDDGQKDALKALKDKAGNVGTFKVSKLYRSRCASCHGVNGDGIIGPKLYGQTAKYVYDKMKDYKTGRLENPVMRGILINVDEKQLKQLSDEIGKFKK